MLLKPENLNSKPRELRSFKSYGDVFRKIEKEYVNVNDGKSFTGFKGKYSKLVQIKADSSLAYKFGTPLSALFTNEKGEVMIGNFMTVYTNDHRMISYTGQYKNHSQIMSVKKTDAIQGIFVSSISKGISVSTSPPTGPPTTSNMKSELYYNQDGKRRLFVDLWKEKTPIGDVTWTPPEQQVGSFHFYFTSRQELKKTFGGWRTNETNYNFTNLSYSYRYYRFPANDLVSYDYNLPSYNINGVYGPIYIDLGTVEAYSILYFTGSGYFTSGGVPSTPSFNLY